MRYSPRTLSRMRTATVMAFIVSGLGLFAVLWAKSGGTIPGVTGHGYQISAEFPNIENLAHASTVEMAGVPIGTVTGLQIEHSMVKVDMVLHRNGPLHQGATAQILNKTLVGETYVQLTDGNGKTLPSGSVLPPSADKNYTSINQLFNSLRTPTRRAASALLTELNAATAGQSSNLSTILTGLGQVASQGGTVMSVLANQSADLQQLVSQTATLLGALDEGQGQIAGLASAAQQVTSATAGESGALSQAVQQLPGVITTAHAASGAIETLSSNLTPIATNLKVAAPQLDEALQALPGTVQNLLGVLQPLQTTLSEAPATLQPLPVTARDLNSLLPPAASLLSNVNPMVAYLDPYKADISAFIANFASTWDHYDPLGSYFAAYVQPALVGEGHSGILATSGSNPFPPPGVSGTDPNAPWNGVHPQVPQEHY